MSLAALLQDPAARAVAKARATNRAAPAAEHRSCIVNAERGRREAEVRIYGVIDPLPWEELGDVSAYNFVRELEALDVDDLRVRINSPGGDVYDAIAITNALRNHPARVTVQVDGLAASAASFIAMAGDEIIMGRNAEMMIHDARGVCLGDATDMAQYAGWLDRVSDNIAAMYADRAGGTAQEWREAMTAETWYSDREAVDAGLADKVAPKAADADGGSDADGKTAAARFGEHLRDCAHTGRANAPTPFFPAATAAGAQGKEAIVATLNEGLAERLGIDADADDETILNALDDKLAEPDVEPPAEPSVEQVSQIAASHGLRVIDEAKLADLQRQAAEGAQARAEQIAAAHAGVVDDAIGKGKIAPARREHFLNLMKADTEGTTALLGSLPDETAVPINEVGHGVTPENKTEDLGWFDSPATPKEA